MSAHNEQKAASKALQRIRTIASQAGTEQQHGPQFVAGMRRAANLLEKAITATPAAPVTAAPTLDDELAQDRMSELSKLERDVLDALPAVYYMDPPDGGDVSLGEQVKRMAEDAALWRKHISTPAAPGIDLTDLADTWVRSNPDPKMTVRQALNMCARSLRDALIDASSKGVSEAVSVKRNCAPPSWMFPEDGGATTEWRAKAAAWIEEQAVEQEHTNAAYPAHVAAYPSWADRVHWLRALADKVVQAQAGDAEVQP